MSPSDTTSLQFDERRLRDAMLTGNVRELDLLLHPELLFIGPDGGIYGKEDDLALHRTGQPRMTSIDILDERHVHHAEASLASVMAHMKGTFKGQAFAGDFQYLRLWIRSPDGWQVAGGSVAAITAAPPSKIGT